MKEEEKNDSMQSSDLDEFNDEVRELGDVMKENTLPWKTAETSENRRVTSMRILRESEYGDTRLPKKEGLL